ncbi:MAG: DMT family transporter [Firmicutes bacterium]|nr:DMT family transporter [Bacillota bacterium]
MRSKHFYFALVGVVIVAWGSVYPATRYLTLDGVSPYFISVMRVLITFVAATVMVPLSGQKWNAPAFKKHFWPFVAMGFTGAFGFFILMNVGVQYTQAGESALIVGLNPLLIVIFSSLLLGEPFGWRKALGVVLAFFGIVLAVVGGGVFAHTGFSWGWPECILLLAAVCWASYTLLSRRYGHCLSYLQGFFWIFASAFVMSLPMLIYYLPDISSLTLTQWLWLLYLGLGPGGVCFLLWAKGVNVLGASVCGMINSFMPICSILISGLWLGEPLTWMQITGALLVAAGVWQGVSKTALPVNYETGRSLEAADEG